jgi:uncharacterized protein (DUF885 family)
MLKRTLKIIGKAFAGLLALLLLIGGVFAVNAWYFKPWSINVFYNRVFIKAALDSPELLTQLHMVEGLGIKGHQSKLDDISPEKQLATLQVFKDELATLHRYDRAGLKGQEALSYDVLDNFLTTLAEGERFAFHDYPMNQLFGVQSNVPNFMLTQHPVEDLRDAEDYLARLAGFPVKFQQLLAGLKIREQKGVLPPRFVIDKVLTEMQGFTSKPAASHELVVQFSEKLNKIKALTPEQRKSLIARATEAVQTSVYPSYQPLIQYYQGLQGKVTRNDGVWALPDGAAYYRYLVKSETTSDYTPAQIHQLGLSEVTRIGGEMEAILQAQGLTTGTLGSRIQAIGARSDQQYPNDDAGRALALKDYQRILDEIDAGLKDSFNIRPKQGMKVERVPVFKEKTAPGAYYQPPALDGSRVGTFYANLADMKDTPKFGMRTLAYHEGIPGHHFQIALAQELEGLPIFRTVLPFTAYAEGWALYSERLAWELGFQKDPLDNLGRLQAEMFRAVRLVVDTGLHDQRWSREQAIAYMIDHTGMTDKEVTVEIERYLVNPGQALAYKVGMIQILDLREAAKAKLGAKFSLKGFHDVVLKNGSLPLFLLKQQVEAWVAGQS